jgi:hypothetical protein
VSKNTDRNAYHKRLETATSDVFIHTLKYQTCTQGETPQVRHTVQTGKLNRKLTAIVTDNLIYQMHTSMQQLNMNRQTTALRTMAHIARHQQPITMLP